jgi:NADPH2:quinone reductase
MGLFISDLLPAVLTNDVVGTVVALGPGVTALKVGDRVISHAGFGGKECAQNGLQEYAVHDVGAGFVIPDDVESNVAALLPTNVIAPLFALFDKVKGVGIPAPWTEEAKSFDFANHSILIVGGGSNCGKYAVQLASLAGIGKIVVVGGQEDELKRFGATHILDRHTEQSSLVEKIRNIVGDDLVSAFDAVNPPSGQVLAANALSNTKKGKLARLLPLGPIDQSKVQGKTAGFETFDVFGSSQVNKAVAYPFVSKSSTATKLYTHTSSGNVYQSISSPARSNLYNMSLRMD